MTDKVKTKTVDFVDRKVTALHYAGDQWQAAGIRPVRFDAEGVGYIAVSEDGELVSPVVVDGEVVAAVPAKGDANVPLPRGFVLGETKTRKVEVAAD